MKKIYVVGTGVEGQEGFRPRVDELIRRTEVLYGSARQLALFSDFPGEKVDIGDNAGKLVAHLQSGDRQAVVLASGDPLFFSLGRDLLRNFPSESLEFIPNVSSVQYAFAKLKEPWDDAVFISASGRGLKKTVDRIVANDKAAILTDAVHTPAAIAAELIERGRDGYAAYLCENLGMADERIVTTDVRGLPSVEASPLNVLILIKKYDGGAEDSVPVLGIADEEFASVKKQITRVEVRAVTLSKLQLRGDMTLWDIGAGSGSVSIEADHLLSNGRIFALERNAQYLGFLKENLRRFNARNVTVIEGEAPSSLDGLPDPDRVFIGGSGGNLWGILAAVDARLPAEGRVVLNAVTLDTLTAAIEFFDNAGYQVEVTTINIARTQPLTDYKKFEAYDPVSVVVAVKQ